MENKTNIEVLDELHAKALEAIRAMLPILAAERGVEVGRVHAEVSAAMSYDRLSFYEKTEDQDGNPWHVGTSWSWNGGPSRSASAVEGLIADANNLPADNAEANNGK